MKRIKSTFLQIWVLLFLGCLSLYAQDVKTLHEKDFNVKEGEALRLDTSTGDVYISTWDKPVVHVKISGNRKAKDKMKFRFEKTDEGVKIVGKRDSWTGFLFFNFSNVYVKYEIKLPENFNAGIKTSGGDIRLYDLAGEIKIETSGGDINLFNTKGKTRLSTSGGDISLENSKGNFDLSTSGGDITTQNLSGDLIAHTSGGDIKLLGQDGRIKASTSGGDIILDYNGSNKGVDLSTSGGDIRVKVKNEISANLELSTSGGDIECSLPTTRTRKISSTKFLADVNGGGEVFHCETSGGDIRVTQ